jgi:hypothetical protein
MELEHEIRGKTLEISLYSPVEVFRFHSVKFGKIDVKHHLVTSNEIDFLFNVSEFRRMEVHSTARARKVPANQLQTSTQA